MVPLHLSGARSCTYPHDAAELGEEAIVVHFEGIDEVRRLSCTMIAAD